MNLLKCGGIVLLTFLITACGGGGGSTTTSGTTTIQLGGARQGIPLMLTGVVSTLAGTDGTGAAATYLGPSGVTNDGTNLYVAEANSNKIRKIVIATGVVTTIAGSGAAGAMDGPGATASFLSPYGITTDGTNLYVADTFNNKIRKIVIATGSVSSLTGVMNTAGTLGAMDGASSTATFNHPYGITTDGINLYVSDQINSKIRKIVISTGDVSSLTGVANTQSVGGATDGVSSGATFNWPYGITTDGTNLYVADMANNKIRKIVISTGAVSSLTGITNVAGVPGAIDGAGASASFFQPQGITTDGTYLYVTDSNNCKIRKIVISTGDVSSLTGVLNTQSAAGAVNGVSSGATFYWPIGITTDGASLYVGDYFNNAIRKIR